MYTCGGSIRKLEDTISTSSSFWQKLFVARTGVFLFKEYSSARTSGSDVELELSQVPQNTCFSKNGTWTESTKGCW
jgi:hypothetical protein